MSPKEPYRGDEPPRGRKRTISVDASVRGEWAGIAAIVHARDVRVLFIDVLKVDERNGNMVGERAAIEKAMRIAEKAGWTQVVFRTDAGVTPRYEIPDGVDWEVRDVPRAQNVAAHTVACEGLRLWLAGRAGETTY